MKQFQYIGLSDHTGNLRMHSQHECITEQLLGRNSSSGTVGLAYNAVR
jgi:hypothetical protein